MAEQVEPFLIKFAKFTHESRQNLNRNNISPKTRQPRPTRVTLVDRETTDDS